VAAPKARTATQGSSGGPSPVAVDGDAWALLPVPGIGPPQARLHKRRGMYSLH
jgi:hypothetical protein